MARYRSIASVATLVSAAGAASADTTDVTWQNRVVIEKQGEFCSDDPNCFNRYHPEIEPVATAAPGTSSSSRRGTRWIAI